MSTTLDAESTITDRYQTTVPASVRRALGLGKRDKLIYDIRSDGEVVLSRAKAPEQNDPVLGQFLSFLENDMAAHPEQIQRIDPELQKRVHDLVGHIDVDLDAPLETDNE